MEKCTFFNDIDDDRIYFAEDLARHLSQFFTTGIFNNGCKVLAENNDMSVNVGVGSANINGYRYDNDDQKKLNIDNADGVLNRIDNIVIRLDLTNRLISAQVIKGTFADNPTAPALVRTSTIYDIRIAKVYVDAGITTITQDLVEDTRFNTNDCGNVVAAVNTPDTTELFSQFETKFNNWFQQMKDKLSGDIAGNLQNQINTINTNMDNINGIFYNEEGEWELDEDYE